MQVRFVLGVRYAVWPLLAVAVSVGFLVILMGINHNFGYLYLLWNLFLAAVPFVLALWLRSLLRRKPWSSWPALGVTIAWLAFLPNSFYMITDFIHLADVGSDQLLFAAVTFSSLIGTGLLFGFGSLYMIHTGLRKRLDSRTAALCVYAILFLCSVAMYIGRDLRWNTWDILIDPAGVLFDLSTRVLHPAQYGGVVAVILPFFILLGAAYAVIWRMVDARRIHDL